MITRNQRRADKADYLGNNPKHSAGRYWEREMTSAAFWRKRAACIRRFVAPEPALMFACTTIVMT